VDWVDWLGAERTGADGVEVVDPWLRRTCGVRLLRCPSLPVTVCVAGLAGVVAVVGASACAAATAKPAPAATPPVTTAAR
jgi:hypothetical protein